jgi:transcriptional regulator NrdR family protein
MTCPKCSNRSAVYRTKPRFIDDNTAVIERVHECYQCQYKWRGIEFIAPMSMPRSKRDVLIKQVDALTSIMEDARLIKG